MLPLFLILTAAFAILTWKNLHAGLLLLVAVLPSYLLRTEIFGVPTTLLELLVVTYLLIWSIKFLGSRKLPAGAEALAGRQLAPNPTTGRRLKPAATTFTIALLLLASTISVFIAPDLVRALGVWKAYFVEPILLFFVVRYELTASTQDAKRSYGAFTSNSIFQALGVSAIILSLVAIFQWLTNTGLPIPWDIERRVTSVFDYPNALGLYLGPVVVIGFLNCLTPPSPPLEREGKRVLLLFTRGGWEGSRLSWFWVCVLILSSFAIILAQSEAAIVSIIATLLIAGLVYKKTRVLSSSLIVLSIVAALLFPPLFQKLTLQDYSGSVRLSQWSETVNMIKDHWFLGAGLSGYPTVFEPYHQATHLEIFQYPHNIVLNIWVELGLLGLLAVGLLGWQVLHLGSSITFFVLLQMTIHGLVDVPYFKNDLAILTWILLAIVLSKDCFAGAPAVANQPSPRLRLAGALAGRHNDTTYVSPSTPPTPS